MCSLRLQCILNGTEYILVVIILDKSNRFTFSLLIDLLLFLSLLFEDAICDLKLSNSSFVSSNMKSLGKRLRFLLTASFSRLVSLP